MKYQTIPLYRVEKHIFKRIGRFWAGVCDIWEPFDDLRRMQKAAGFTGTLKEASSIAQLLSEQLGDVGIVRKIPDGVSEDLENFILHSNTGYNTFRIHEKYGNMDWLNPPNLRGNLNVDYSYKDDTLNVKIFTPGLSQNPESYIPIRFTW